MVKRLTFCFWKSFMPHYAVGSGCPSTEGGQTPARLGGSASGRHPEPHMLRGKGLP